MPAIYEQDFKVAEIRAQQRAGVVEALEDLGVRMIAAISRIMDEKGVNFDGDAKKSLNAQVEDDGRRIRLVVGFGVIYAAAIEFGHGPRWVRVRPLQRWARRKIGLSETEAERVGYAIQYKLATVGREGDFVLRDMMRRDFDRLARQFVADLNETLS